MPCRPRRGVRRIQHHRSRHTASPPCGYPAKQAGRCLLPRRPTPLSRPASGNRNPFRAIAHPCPQAPIRCCRRNALMPLSSMTPHQRHRSPGSHNLRQRGPLAARPRFLTMRFWRRPRRVLRRYRTARTPLRRAQSAQPVSSGRIRRRRRMRVSTHILRCLRTEPAPRFLRRPQRGQSTPSPMLQPGRIRSIGTIRKPIMARHCPVKPHFSPHLCREPGLTSRLLRGFPLCRRALRSPHTLPRPCVHPVPETGRCFLPPRVPPLPKPPPRKRSPFRGRARP